MRAKSPRDKIIHAAMELFWLKGFQSTSIADLLSRTQLNSGSLYHIFPSKQHVLIGVLEAYRDGIGVNLLQPAWGAVEDPIEKIFALLAFYRTALAETDCTYGCPIGSLALELHEPDPDVRALLAENFRNWARAVEACLDAVVDQLPTGTDREALSNFVLITMEGAVMLARTFRDLQYFDQATAQLRAHFSMLANRVEAREAHGAG